MTDIRPTIAEQTEELAALHNAGADWCDVCDEPDPCDASRFLNGAGDRLAHKLATRETT